MYYWICLECDLLVWDRDICHCGNTKEQNMSLAEQRYNKKGTIHMENTKCPLGGDGTQVCGDCTYPCAKNNNKKKDDTYRAPRMSAYERTRRDVYATGNRWAIENFHATHD